MWTPAFHDWGLKRLSYAISSQMPWFGYHQQKQWGNQGAEWKRHFSVYLLRLPAVFLISSACYSLTQEAPAQLQSGARQGLTLPIAHFKMAAAVVFC